MIWSAADVTFLDSTVRCLVVSQVEQLALWHISLCDSMHMSTSNGMPGQCRYLCIGKELTIVRLMLDACIPEWKEGLYARVGCESCIVIYIVIVHCSPTTPTSASGLPDLYIGEASG